MINENLGLRIHGDYLPIMIARRMQPIPAAAAAKIGIESPSIFFVELAESALPAGGARGGGTEGGGEGRGAAWKVVR